LIRYTFYALGALAFGLIGLSLLKVFNAVSFYRIAPVDEVPAFRLVDSELVRLSMLTKVTSGASLGRVETRQYGQPHDRSVNLSITLMMPPKLGSGTNASFADVRNALVSSSSFSGTGVRYDLETRFGPVRAAETRINADGLIKPCLAFQSRFETLAVRLDGSFCEAAGGKPSPQRLACILDTLVLDNKLASADADAFLRERMTRRALCTATPVTQTMDTQQRPVSPPSRWSAPSATRR
jgi:hypothetical protein